MRLLSSYSLATFSPDSHSLEIPSRSHCLTLHLLTAERMLQIEAQPSPVANPFDARIKKLLLAGLFQTNISIDNFYSLQQRVQFRYSFEKVSD